MKRLKNPLHRMWVRRRLVKLQGGLCCYCGRSFAKRGPTSPTIEHKKAIMDGATDDLANLAAACLHCNQHRGTQKNRSKQKAERIVSNLQQSSLLARSHICKWPSAELHLSGPQSPVPEENRT
jgi:5-methylcytosine-specific restriction endonuclease McrA